MDMCTALPTSVTTRIDCSNYLQMYSDSQPLVAVDKNANELGYFRDMWEEINGFHKLRSK